MTQPNLESQPLDQSPRPPAVHEREPGVWISSRYDDVVGVLRDSRYIVPTNHQAESEEGSVSWLRAHVARFANGPTHDQYRAPCDAELGRMNIDALRKDAHRRTLAIVGSCPDDAVDVMSTVARRVPLSVLAIELGCAEEHLESMAEAVIELAKLYLGPSDLPTPDADVAVLNLTRMLPNDDPTVLANRIGLLAQTCEATAGGLIGNALAAWASSAAHNESVLIDDLLTEILRYDPPVRLMRRAVTQPIDVSGSVIPTDSTMLLDVASANRDPEAFAHADAFIPERRDGRHLTFGAGIRPCPGEHHALALAAGVIAAVIETFSRAGAEVQYGEPSPVRVPRTLIMRRK